jgi:phosphatidate cytidylyltransferase
VLRYRLVSAIVLIPLILGAVLIGGPVFFALVLIAALVCGYEFYEMARGAGYQPNRVLGLALIVLLLWVAEAEPSRLRDLLAAALVLSLVLAIFGRNARWIAGWGLTLAGALYLGILATYFLLLESLPNGRLWTGIILLGTWATDTAAFVVGKACGRHGFFTSISPKKTWEGAIGGWVAATVSVLVLGWIAGLGPGAALLLGFGVGIAATFGDLAESVLKRQLGAKDSGALVPGHGGLLDRIDSLLFAAVFGYYFLTLFLRA